jgi:hypothetical protein
MVLVMVSPDWCLFGEVRQRGNTNAYLPLNTRSAPQQTAPEKTSVSLIVTGTDSLDIPSRGRRQGWFANITGAPIPIYIQMTSNICSDGSPIGSCASSQEQGENIVTLGICAAIGIVTDRIKYNKVHSAQPVANIVT